VTDLALAADGIWWRYHRDPWLLSDLSLDVPQGGLLRVRGGNGSGKSTLLRLLAGCVEPHRGRIRRAGPVGYLPQLARGLPPVRAGRLLVLLGGRERPEDPALDGHLGTRADELSGGTARRLLLDVVLGLDTPLLVLDEPTSGLDAEGVDRLAGVLAERLAAGAAVVVAEHRPLPVPGGDVLDLGGSRDPDLVQVTLGGDGVLRGRAARDGVLTISVAPGDREALLLEALQAGWSVLGVGPRR
jgi:ABC-type multidrug transport system ATPase subunit